MKDSLDKVNTAFDHAINVVFLLLLVFLMVGSCMAEHREQATLGVLLLVAGWVMSKILHAGIQSMVFFFTKKTQDHDNNDNDTHNKED
jgi:hypothetical protein